MTLQWIACDLRTGSVMAELPDLKIDTVDQRVGAYSSNSATLPVASTPAPPANWLRATEPYKSMLVALNDDGDPIWQGMVVKRQRDGGSPVSLALTTPEGYFSRRYVRTTLQYPQTDRLFIASDLANRYILDGAGGRPGLPLRVDIQSDGAFVDGDYADQDDRSIYSIYQDLGHEWTITGEWQTNPTRVTLVLALSDRLGVAASPTFGPAVTFDWPSQDLISAQVVDDYSDGRGANDVMGTSTGSGSVRPQSDHQVATQPDRPTIEQRLSVGSNITSRATLNSLSQQILANTKDGARTFAVALPVSSPRAFAFGMGDDVGLDFSGPEFPDHPQTVARLAGRTLTASVVTPIFLDSGDDDE
jgi:hypothetical protein